MVSIVELGAGTWTCMTAVRRSPPVLQGVDEPASLEQEKGRVR
jgi:hypothetical protein